MGLQREVVRKDRHVIHASACNYSHHYLQSWNPDPGLYFI